MTIKTHLLVLTPADNGNREDCSVFYSRYLLVTTDSLNFDEPVFEIGDTINDDKKLLADIRALGYTVEEIDSTIICSDDENADDYNNDDPADDPDPFAAPYNPWSLPK